jgi:AraC-like DNA-binding protein
MADERTASLDWRRDIIRDFNLMSVDEPTCPAGADTVSSKRSEPEGEGEDQAITLIPILRYSTDDLPAEERYRAWSLRDWPRTQPIYHTEPIEPFNTRWESAQLGEVTFVHTEISGMRWERRARDIRLSDFDPVIVNMMIEGEAQGDMDGRAFHESAGELHFQDLARPSVHVSTASRSWSLVLPRPVAEARFAPLHDLHGTVIRGPGAAALFAYAEHVHGLLPRIDLSESERLGRVFLDLLGVVLLQARPSIPSRLGVDAILRLRAVEEIERRLATDISIIDLARALGVTRTRLFAIFKPDGGVRAYIMIQRLERARTALGEATLTEGIGNLALRFGFGDAPHFSRSFRKRYGMAPKDYRRLATAALDEVAQS